MAFGLAVYAPPRALPVCRRNSLELRDSSSTQDSLLAVGQTLPDGIHTRRVTIKGFRLQCQFISSSRFAKLLGANTFIRLRSEKPSPLGVGARISLVKLATQFGLKDAADLFLSEGLKDFPNSKQLKALSVN